jgi:hypothetical protein
MTVKKDFTQVAHAVFVQATGGPPVKTDKQLAGRQGGLKGGQKRMQALTEEQRLELAAKGVAARKPPAPSDAGGVKVTKSSR